MNAAPDSTLDATPATTSTSPPTAGTEPRLTGSQWRQIARLARWMDSEPQTASAAFGPRASAAVAAMRQARAAGRRGRLDGVVARRPLPLGALGALADAAARFEARRQARPAGWFAAAATAAGPKLVLQMPALKAWLRESFAQAAAAPDGTLPAGPAERTREVLMRRVMALGAAEDSYLRRRHLLQLLSDHGYSQPLLDMARRAARDWAPQGWADDWRQVAGLEQDESAIATLGSALTETTRSLQSWTAKSQPKPAPRSAPQSAPEITPESAPESAADTAPPPAPQPASRSEPRRERRPGPQTQPPAAAPEPSPATVARHPAVATAKALARRLAIASRVRLLPALQRWARNPQHVLWTAAAVAVAAIGVGLAMHLSGPGSARWVTYFENDGTTLSIDPDSIERSGRQLSYRVAVVRRREDSSAVAWYTADCDTRQRRLESVQHYRGTRFETALRREVRGKPVGPWPSGGADVRLLQAACARV